MINLKNTKIFKKKKEEISQEEIIIDKKTISIYGSVGSGKSTLAIKLAKKLANNKQNVVVIFCDMTTPIMPCIAIENEFEVKKSIGSILTSSKITENLIKNNLSILKDNNYLAFLGFIEGENEYTYPDFEAERMYELFFMLKDIFDYIIIDCSSNISNNILSFEFAKLSDVTIKLGTQDAKSMSYFVSQEMLLRNNNFLNEKVALKVINGYRNNIINEVFNGSDYEFPYIDEIRIQLEERNMTKELKSKDGIVIYNKEIDRMCKGVFGI